MMKKTKYNRVLIHGAGSGSGKNWFGEKLSKKSKIKFYDTDDLAYVKRFTIKRDYDKKCKMLNDIAKKDTWIMATGATSYISPAEKRADLIIILDIGFIRSTYRIVKRYYKHKIKKIEEQTNSAFKHAYLNFLHHSKKNKHKDHIKELIKKYPKKVKVFSQKEKRKFLNEFY
jgi:adenylate kinase family enzyme